MQQPTKSGQNYSIQKTSRSIRIALGSAHPEAPSSWEILMHPIVETWPQMIMFSFSYQTVWCETVFQLLRLWKLVPVFCQEVQSVLGKHRNKVVPKTATSYSEGLAKFDCTTDLESCDLALMLCFVKRNGSNSIFMPSNE